MQVQTKQRTPFNKRTVEHVADGFRGSNVLMRVDYNTPPGEAWGPRVSESFETIKFLFDHGARLVILLSHRGRPKAGQRGDDFSLRPIAERMREEAKKQGSPIFGREIVFVGGDIREKSVKNAVWNAEKGTIIVLENVRYMEGETENSKELAWHIITNTCADIFVQDGFGALGKAQTTTVALAERLLAVAGLLVKKEATFLDKLMEELRAKAANDESTLLISGGAKVDEKEPLIKSLSSCAKYICVVGKIAAEGYDALGNEKIYVAEDFARDRLDIGPKSIVEIVEKIKEAKIIIWNGTAGKTEDPEFAAGSIAIAEAIAENKEALVLIAGGDTVSFLEKLWKERPDLDFGHVNISTGGGATLKYLSGEYLPGLDILPEQVVA